MNEEMIYDYDKVYVNDIPFPYTPVHDAGQNDVKTLDFKVPTMTGAEMKELMAMRNPVWFTATFFDESEWKIVHKKMYCSSPKYTKYYIDPVDPLKNIYQNVQFGFVEE